jgi:predicted TIM-barrel fold metal-dependent hydrolase
VHYAQFPPHILSKLESLDDERIWTKEMSPSTSSPMGHAMYPHPFSEINDELAAAISKNSSRLVAFATPPLSEPRAAAKELERCVDNLEFVGVLVENHLDGQFYDGEQYWPVFRKAEELNPPLYIHPMFASHSMMKHYKGNYKDSPAWLLVLVVGRGIPKPAFTS